MTKFIFSITAAVTAMIGQAYGDHTKVATDNLKPGSVKVQLDSVCKQKPATLFTTRKNQLPS